MTSFVLDASAALAWCFRDEATEASRALLDQMIGAEVYVPALFPLELANALTMAERRGKLTTAEGAQFVALVERLPFSIDHTTHMRALNVILDLARAERLTSYDAAYVDLAMRVGVPLATRDHEVRKAASRLGVALLAA